MDDAWICVGICVQYFVVVFMLFYHVSSMYAQYYGRLSFTFYRFVQGRHQIKINKSGDGNGQNRMGQIAADDCGQGSPHHVLRIEFGSFRTGTL